MADTYELLELSLIRRQRLVRKVTETRDLLLHQKHNDSGYALACRDAAALLTQLLLEEQ